MFFSNSLFSLCNLPFFFFSPFSSLGLYLRYTFVANPIRVPVMSFHLRNTFVVRAPVRGVGAAAPVPRIGPPRPRLRRHGTASEALPRGDDRSARCAESGEVRLEVPER